MCVFHKLFFQINLHFQVWSQCWGLVCVSARLFSVFFTGVFKPLTFRIMIGMLGPGQPFSELFCACWLWVSLPQDGCVWAVTPHFKRHVQTLRLLRPAYSPHIWNRNILSISSLYFNTYHRISFCTNSLEKRRSYYIYPSSYQVHSFLFLPKGGAVLLPLIPFDSKVPWAIL